jgi:hypothetical protein
VDFIDKIAFTCLKIIEKRVLSHWRTKDLMPYENPPMIFVSPDNIEWTFLQTIPDDAKLEQFRFKNYCKFIPRDNKCLRKRFRYVCHRKFHKEKCKFMLMAMKNTKFGFHVYQHGEHNHPEHKLKQMEDDEEESDEDQDSEEENEEDSKKDNEEDDDDVDVDEQEKPQQQQIPNKITKYIKGGKRNYFYQTTLKSVKELGEFGYKVMKKE